MNTVHIPTIYIFLISIVDFTFLIQAKLSLETLESRLMSRKGLTVGKHRESTELKVVRIPLGLLKIAKIIRKMQERVLKKTKVLTRRKMVLIALDPGDDWEVM